LSKSRPFTILCVDDEAGALLIRKTLLEHAGYAVLTAVNAKDALAVFTAQRIDLVVSDHLLPGVPALNWPLKSKRRGPASLFCCFQVSWSGPRTQLTLTGSDKR